MDVTKHNLEAGVKKFEELCKNPNLIFIAVDAEFTGLHLRDETPSSDKESPQTKLERDIMRASKFSVSQLGIALFFTNSSHRHNNNSANHSPSLQCYPFNINVFPGGDNDGTYFLDSEFTVQSESLRYLLYNGFDANKWIKHGAPFMTQHKYKQMQSESSVEKWIQIEEKKLLNKYSNLDSFKTWNVAENDSEGKQLMKAAVERVEKFYNSIKDCGDDESKMKKSYIVIECPNYQRNRIIFKEIFPRFHHSQLVFSSNPTQNHHICVFANKKVAQRVLHYMLRSRYNDLLRQYYGATQFFDTLSNTKVPIVFHNGLLDCTHLYNSFIQRCHDYDSKTHNTADIVANLRRSLPCIIDTKLLVKKLPLLEQFFSKKTSLNQLYFMLRTSQIEPYVSLHKDCQLYKPDSNSNQSSPHNKHKSNKASHNHSKHSKKSSPNKSKHSGNSSHNDSSSQPFHEAGFDAYVTGVVFAKLCGLMAKVNYICATHCVMPKQINDLISKKIPIIDDSDGSPLTNGKSKDSSTDSTKLDCLTKDQFWIPFRNLVQKLGRSEADEEKSPHGRESAKHPMLTNGLLYPMQPTLTPEQNVLNQLRPLLNRIYLMNNIYGNISFDDNFDDATKDDTTSLSSPPLPPFDESAQLSSVSTAVEQLTLNGNP